MKKHPADACAVSPDGTLRDVLAALHRSNLGIALLQGPEGPLRGIATEADLRTLLLSGAGLDEPALRARRDDAPTYPVATPLETIAAALEAQPSLRLPLLDTAGRALWVVHLEASMPRNARSHWALILVGGEGKRLRPLTEDVPKPMLPVRGRPLLEDILLNLRESGFRRVYLATRYLADRIREHFQDGARLGMDLRYLTEPEPLGTAGPIRLLPEAPKETLLVMNGDLLTRVDFEALFRTHAERKADATLASVARVVRIPYGVLEFEADRLREIREKPELRLQASAGIYLFEPSALARLPAGRCDMPDFLNLLAAGGAKVVSHPLQDYWLDIGQGRDYARAQEDLSLLDP